MLSAAADPTFPQSQPMFASLSLPALEEHQAKPGTNVQTREFYACSKPGNKAVVVKAWPTPYGVMVKCNYGRIGSKTILKTMPLSVLALAND